ncbi:expressed unknown protein [Seminavis robusta]|uniref:Uncharacterized protein n=1 Tax=Seminavis robusta TaxID=568900 RepID=A0A9N8DNI8_9STRA|nr:expressed unknown protein [Seminavis robusta]|eukprot:Sro181_g079060.1 n/a (642) ;mRNA; r:41680-43605
MKTPFNDSSKSLTEDETILSDLVNDDDDEEKSASNVVFWDDAEASGDDDSDSFGCSFSSIIPLEIFQGSTTSIASDIIDGSSNHNSNIDVLENPNAAKHTRGSSNSQLASLDVFDSLLAGIDTESETEDLQVQEFPRKDSSSHSGASSTKKKRRSKDKRRSRSVPRTSATKKSSSGKTRTSASGKTRTSESGSSSRTSASGKARTSGSEKQRISGTEKTRTSLTDNVREEEDSKRNSSGRKTSRRSTDRRTKEGASRSPVPMRRSKTADQAVSPTRRTTEGEPKMRRSKTTEATVASPAKRTSEAEPKMKRAMTASECPPPKPQPRALQRAGTAPPDLQNKRRSASRAMKDGSSNSTGKKTRTSPRRSHPLDESNRMRGSRIRRSGSVNNRLSAGTGSAAVSPLRRTETPELTLEERQKRRRANRRATSDRGLTRRQGSHRSASLSPKRESSTTSRLSVASMYSPVPARPQRRNRVSLDTSASSHHEPRTRYSRARTLARCSVVSSQLSQTVHNAMIAETTSGREVSEEFAQPNVKETGDNPTENHVEEQKEEQPQEHAAAESRSSKKTSSFGLAGVVKAAKKYTTKKTAKAATAIVRDSLYIPSLSNHQNGMLALLDDDDDFKEAGDNHSLGSADGARAA